MVEWLAKIGYSNFCVADTPVTTSATSAPKT